MKSAVNFMVATGNIPADSARHPPCNAPAVLVVAVSQEVINLPDPNTNCSHEHVFMDPAHKWP